MTMLGDRARFLPSAARADAAGDIEVTTTRTIQRTIPQPPRLEIGVHYSVEPNRPRCIFTDRHNRRCQRSAHALGAHVL